MPDGARLLRGDDSSAHEIELQLNENQGYTNMDKNQLIHNLADSLEQMTRVASLHDDCGPLDEGWKSDELKAQIKSAGKLIEQARMSRS